MKKLLFIAAISLGVVVSSNAQETKFGVKAGVNLANVTGDVGSSDMVIGFQVGGYAHLGLSDAFAIQPELLFDQKGFSQDFFNQDFSDKSTSKSTYNYITVPILAKYMIKKKLDIHLGPQIGILMSATNDGEDISDGLNSTDIGIAAGAGYELESGINFSVRYSMSLTSIAEDFEFTNPVTMETTTLESDIKNSVISIAVGFSF